MSAKKKGSSKSKGKKQLPEVYNKLLNVGAYDSTHKKQLQQRANKVQQLYKQAVDKIAKAAAPSLFDADPAKEFHFEDIAALNKAVDETIDDMGKQLQLNVEDGDSDAWTLANTKNDMVVNAIASVYSIPEKTLQVWRHPHLDALQQFEERRKNGMNLSNGGSEKDLRKGVWNLDQFKNELELALEQGIGQGKSAADLSRDVRQYLKYPNKLFHRVRDKDGNLRLSKAAAAFHPGRGVYRSSYKNALRLTATENNIAYRTCDHKRWNALPFVIGQEIKTSNNHPVPDICDTLAGKYPKEFKFTGWHPFCRCYSVSILASEKEMDDYCSKLEDGNDVSGYEFTGKQTEMPKEFTTWMKENEDRIANAKSMPYFIKDNYKDGDPEKGLLWNVKEETAKERIFRMAAERHAARTQAQKNAFFKGLQAREQKHQQMQDTAKFALDKVKNMPEVDGTQLEKFIKEGDLDNMYDLALKKINEVNKMEARENALADLIPDVHQWHEKHTIVELETTHKAVEKKLKYWATKKYTKQKLRDKLDYEVKWVKDHPKYSTDDVDIAAYTKKRNTVDFEIKQDDLKEQVKDLQAFKTKSKDFTALLDKAVQELGNLTEKNQGTQVKVVQEAIDNAATKKTALENRRKVGTKITKERRDKAVWDTGDGTIADEKLRDIAGETWRNASEEEKDMIYEYTYHYCDKNEPLQLRKYQSNQTRADWERKVNLITSYINKSKLPEDMWFQRGDDEGAIISRLKFAGNKMDKLPDNLQDLVGKEIQEGGFMSTGSTKGKGFNKEFTINIFAPKGTKAAYVEPISDCGNGAKRNWDGFEKQSSFSTEDETVFQRGTRMKIVKVTEKKTKNMLGDPEREVYIDVDIIGQEIKDLSYVPGVLIGY